MQVSSLPSALIQDGPRTPTQPQGGIAHEIRARNKASGFEKLSITLKSSETGSIIDEETAGENEAAELARQPAESSKADNGNEEGANWHIEVESPVIVLLRVGCLFDYPAMDAYESKKGERKEERGKEFEI